MSSPVLAKPLFRDGKISKPSAVIPSEQCDGRKRTNMESAVVKKERAAFSPVFPSRFVCVLQKVLSQHEESRCEMNLNCLISLVHDR